LVLRSMSRAGLAWVNKGRCSPRCVRWYPRVQRAAPDGHGRRRFDYLGGYPTKAAARSALDQALRRHRGRPSDPSTVVGEAPAPTLNDLLDHWLTHLRTNKAVRLRTIGRYRQHLEHHVRPIWASIPSARSEPSTSNGSSKHARARPAPSPDLVGALAAAGATWWSERLHPSAATSTPSAPASARARLGG
jgi:hypothetical protein